MDSDTRIHFDTDLLQTEIIPKKQIGRDYLRLRLL